jgi:hypothetical protein
MLLGSIISQHFKQGAGWRIGILVFSSVYHCGNRFGNGATGLILHAGVDLVTFGI